MTTLARWAMLAGLLLGAPALAAPPDAHITIDNFTFSPTRITVSPGTRVIWANHDDIPHRINDTANPGTIRSPALDTGDTYARVFPRAGSFPYFCSLHPRMQGVVVVQ